MPRFNFDSYISKNSLHDFSSLHDLDPQADWEDKHKTEIADGEQPVENIASTTSSDIDRQLVSEINALTGGEYTLEDLGLMPAYQQYEEEQNDTFEEQGEGFNNLENIDVEITEQTSKDSIETNQSANQQKVKLESPRPAKKMTTSAAVAAPLTLKMADYNEDSFDIKHSKNTKMGPENHIGQMTDGGMFNSTEGGMFHRTSSVKYASPNPIKLGIDQHATSLIYTDSRNVLHPVRNTNEIKNLISVSKPEVMAPLPNEVEEALGRLKNIPAQQVSHFAHLGDYVRHLQANERICDVTVHIGTVKYAAHRICLACYSDYFADIFYSRGEKQRVPLTVRLKGIKPIAFEILLKYIYTGILDVYPDVVGDLMTMAESLRIPMVKTRVIDHLECLPLAEALAILMKEKIFGPLYERVMVAVCEQFNTFRHEGVFLEIDFETLVTILSSDNLNISTELDVFGAAIRWIAHNIMHRKQYLIRLMHCVRFAFMTPTEIFHCNERTDILKGDNQCKMMLLEALWIATAKMLCKEDPYNFAVPKQRIATMHQPLVIRPVQKQEIHQSEAPMETPKKQSAGYSRKVDVEVQSPIMTPRYQSSEPADDTQQPLQDVIVIGGFNPASSRAAVSAKGIERYDKSNNAWKHYSELPEPRLHYAVTILNGKIYVAGGIDPRMQIKNPIPSTDSFVYDIKCNAWIKIMPMNTARMYHSLCSLCGMVYAIGGQDGDNSVLNTVECYNPMTDNWFFVKSMSTARLGAAVGNLGGQMFVTGGYGENISRKSGMPVLDTVESFDPRKNIWTLHNNLRFPRCHGNIVTINGVMYLCGGATRSYTSMDSVISSVSSIDVYNKEHDVWEFCSDMVVSRHDAAVAAVGDLIYIIGGASTQSNRILRSVECFDTSTKSWVPGVQDLPYPSKWIRSLAIVSK
ncbi:kelch-like protein 1/4/5 [Mytilus galloprovincialis]|uniref:Kelch-like protein 1/4/5 n=1 Tax=Mytilus galloprovincialis TaxID=29158 RepID=A0A8B6GQ15_MYTGA|nr:kelch-like protein 1/4/5 [Mytilus galloprovincialis]